MPKKKRATTIMSNEHKAKLAAGREKARQRKLAEKESLQDDEFEPTAVQEAKAAGELQPSQPTEPFHEEQPSSPPLQAPIGFSNEQLMAMMLSMRAEMDALRANNPQAANAPVEAKIDELAAMGNAHNGYNEARVGVNGVTGLVTKYSIEKSHYPDPSQRLLDEPTLRRFAMHENYIFRWEVDGVTYNKHNIDYSEPRFTISLFQKLFDEDGEPTGRMALIARQMMHEDKMFAQMAAMKLGILHDFASIDELMDEIRYQTIKQWLIAIFKPAKVNTFTRKSTTEVINGKVVEVFDTERETDSEAGIAKAGSIASQDGVGKIATPKA